jgi:hypothetical protein
MANHYDDAVRRFVDAGLLFDEIVLSIVSTRE